MFVSPGLFRGHSVSCCTSTTRGCNEPSVNSSFPEGKCDGIWEEHLLFVSQRPQRTTRVRQGSSLRRRASTSSTAWMTWHRYVQWGFFSFSFPPLFCLISFEDSPNRLVWSIKSNQIFGNHLKHASRKRSDLHVKSSVAVILNVTEWKESSCSPKNVPCFSFCLTAA